MAIREKIYSLLPDQVLATSAKSLFFFTPMSNDQKPFPCQPCSFSSTLYKYLIGHDITFLLMHPQIDVIVILILYHLSPSKEHTP